MKRDSDSEVDRKIAGLYDTKVFCAKSVEHDENRAVTLVLTIVRAFHARVEHGWNTVERRNAPAGKIGLFSGPVFSAFLCLCGVILALATFPITAQTRDFTRHVNPFIGTGGHGHTFPGATDAVWDGAALARHAHRQLGRLLRLSLLRRHHLRLFAHAPVGHGHSGWVRYFVDADA